DTSPARPDYYDKVFAAAMSGDPSSLASFAYRAGGPAAGGDVGAPGLRAGRLAVQAGGKADGKAGGGLAVLRVERDPARINRFHFDAGEARMAPGATAVWDFGDGNGARGEKVSHDFARPGEYRVVLRTGTGEGDSTSARVVVPDPQILRLDPRQGLIAGGKPVAGSTPSRGALAIGGKAPAIEVPCAAIAGIFGAPEVALTMEIATTGGGTPSGEILRLHEAFTLGMGPTGDLSLALFAPGQKKPRVLRTAPGLRLNDGAPHRIGLRIGAEGAEITVDGRLAQRVKGAGPLPSVNRPLVLGGAFGKPGLPAAITALTLTAGAESFAP
ncbi:MAG: PKD domain-containing protein, partial [Paracoccaceae bacterium]